MRKNAKRIMAVVTAATMTLGSGITAMAATTAPADSTITGGGDLDYVDTSTVYEVTLPTAGALDFVIDPQGLTSLKEGESAKLEDLLDSSSIVSKEGAGAHIKNESSVGVKVTAKMNITDTNDTKVTPVDTMEAVTANNTTNICLLAIPSSNSPADISAYEASTQGIVISSTDDTAATEFSFVLDKASYSIKKGDDGTLSYAKDDTEGNYDAASFKLGGKANGKADWSAYTGASKKEIGVNAVFSVTDAADADVVGTDYSAHGLMDLGSVKSVELAPAGPSATANGDFSVSKNNTFALKNVTKTIKKIEAAESAADSATVYGQISANSYSVNADKTVLTINGATNGMIGAGGIGKSRCLIITLDDNTVIKVTVKVAA